MKKGCQCPICSNLTTILCTETYAQCLSGCENCMATTNCPDFNRKEVFTLKMQPVSIRFKFSNTELESILEMAVAMPSDAKVKVAYLNHGDNYSDNYEFRAGLFFSDGKRQMLKFDELFPIALGKAFGSDVEIPAEIDFCKQGSQGSQGSSLFWVFVDIPYEYYLKRSSFESTVKL